ncbi:MAG: universal stress protein [Alphaproteobacteria bacterium]
MSIRNILVPVRGDGKGELVLNAAVALAKKFDAHIDVVHARMGSQDMLAYGATLAGVRDVVNEIAETHAADEEARVKKLYLDYCQRHGIADITEPRNGEKGVSASWHEEKGRQANVVARRGRLTDIIFVAQPDGQLGVNTFEAALMETGKPVICVPPRDIKEIGNKIAIAWNDSAEISGAVTSSRPIVEAAAKLLILSAPETHGDELPASDLAKYLRWHGQQSEIQMLDCDPQEVGQTLLKACADNAIDLLLMGGYAHARRHDFKIGGVTQYVVEKAEIPVLFHH